MDRKKLIYIGIILLITVIVSITYFSYAFFTNKQEFHGKLNIVAGTLNYKISSNDLTNNAITLAANEKKVLTIKVTSLNSISSKYELYYTTNNNDIEIGYSSSTVDQPTGTINANQTKKVTVVIKNKSTSTATVPFGVKGGFTSKELVLDSGKSIDKTLNVCDYTAGYVWNFLYNGTTGADGSEQTFTAPCNGNYKLEVWGAQGGLAHAATGTSQATINGGFGAYATGVIRIKGDNNLYINVGGHSSDSCAVTGSSNCLGGYNGGANGWRSCSGSGCSVWYATTSGGGGATSIAKITGLLSSISSNIDDIIIISSGGGGSAGYHTSASDRYYFYGYGGHGGGITGVNSYSNYDRAKINTVGNGATQITGGTGASTGSFGQGGTAGGGGGYYGGGGANRSGAGGGSSYIGNINLINKSMYCYNCSESIESETYTVSTTGSSTLRDTTNCPNGYSSDPISKCAKAGHGYARITYLGE